MDEKALKIVRDYIFAHLDKTDTVPPFEVCMVWKCKALQNWKYLISSTLCDGMYYELTYNGDKKEWYLDAYNKFEAEQTEETAPESAPDTCIHHRSVKYKQSTCTNLSPLYGQLHT